MDSWWEERTLREKIMWGILFGLLGVGFLFLVGWIVMLLWNWLMPDIFGLPRLNYWKAWGLFILSCILFKNVGGGNSESNNDRKRRRELRRHLQEEREWEPIQDKEEEE
jgi:hypothetical protein